MPNEAPRHLATTASCLSISVSLAGQILAGCADKTLRAWSDLGRGTGQAFQPDVMAEGLERVEGNDGDVGGGSKALAHSKSDHRTGYGNFYDKTIRPMTFGGFTDKLKSGSFDETSCTAIEQDGMGRHVIVVADGLHGAVVWDLEGAPLNNVALGVDSQRAVRIQTLPGTAVLAVALDLVHG